MTTLEVLIAARAKIADPARDSSATCWCLEGALNTLPPSQKASRLLNQAVKKLYPNETGTVGVNDNLGHEAILSVCDKAIELARQA